MCKQNIIIAEQTGAQQQKLLKVSDQGTDALLPDLLTVALIKGMDFLVWHLFKIGNMFFLMSIVLIE